MNEIKIRLEEGVYEVFPVSEDLERQIRRLILREHLDGLLVKAEKEGLTESEANELRVLLRDR